MGDYYYYNNITLINVSVETIYRDEYCLLGPIYVSRSIIYIVPRAYKFYEFLIYSTGNCIGIPSFKIKNKKPYLPTSDIDFRSLLYNIALAKVFRSLTKLL